ncbi:hypothetical protein MBLNU459_g4072t1 [Dothideomycetes sp. NU459]
MDDAVVMTVVDRLLESGFVVATFNFRGASGSKGKTSWSGKAERQDYVSVAGLLIHYLHQITPPSLYPSTPPPPAQSLPDHAESESSNHKPQHVTPRSDEQMVVLLAGYSYGSLIASHLPPTNILVSRFRDPSLGSPAHSILLRARTLADQTNDTLSDQRGRHLTLHSPHRHRKTPSHPIVYGGDEGSPSASPAAGADSSTGTHAGADIIRRSAELPQRIRSHIRKRSSRTSVLASPSKKPGAVSRAASGASDVSNPATVKSAAAAAAAAATTAASVDGAAAEMTAAAAAAAAVTPANIRTAYLLISPLLPPLSTVLVPGMPWSLLPWRADSGKSSAASAMLANPALAVFGSEDGFTAAKKLCVWGDRMKGQSSGFEWRRVDGAGHFWREEGVDGELRGIIGAWVASAVTAD